MIKYFLILIFLISATSATASRVVDISFSKKIDLKKIDLEIVDVSFDNTAVKPKFRKLKVVLLTIFLGHFGVHRIYLGSPPNVPVIYSLTLGGGLGFLPLIDLIAILTAKDLEQYTNNNKVFMWSKKTPE